MTNDYISRQVAIDAVNRALDRETLLYSFVRKVAISALKKIAPADVAPVVRCKNCKHHAYDEIFSRYWCEYPGRVRDTTPDGFCEKGEE